MLRTEEESHPSAGEDATLAELREMNRLLRLNILALSGVKQRFLAGLWTGFGTVLGATVLIGLMVRLIAPFTKAEVVGPYLQKLQDQLERPRPDRAVPSGSSAPAPDANEAL
ncbi:MAG: hypothetical protein C4320_09150 [Armatimonadota bacterium]